MRPRPTAPILGVVFDAFGTLVRIGEPRHPYRQVLLDARLSGRASHPDVAKQVMSQAWSFTEFAKWIDADSHTIKKAEEDLRIELASIEPFPEANSVLLRLRERGFRIGLCSNLATPYAEPLRTRLPIQLDAYAWSFEVGAIKPDPKIYRSICNALALAPENILFVGDTYIADVEGPRAFGMQAIHLARDDRSPDDSFLHSLDGLIADFGHS